MRRWLRNVTVWMVTMILVAGAPVALLAQDATPPSEVTERSPVEFAARPDGGTDGDPFVIEVEPGGSADLTLWVLNAGTIPFAVDTFIADVSTARQGGIAMAPQGSEQHEPTTWVDFPDQVIELQPGEEIPVVFTVTVPEDAASGQHINAVAVQTVDAYSVEGTTMLLQRVQKVLPLYIIVPGEMVASFTLGEPVVEFGRTGGAIVVPITNTGNVRLAPVGTMTIKDGTGVELLSMPIALLSVFGGHSTVFAVQMNPNLPVGQYLVSVELSDATWEATASFEDRVIDMPEPPEQPVRTTVEVVSTTVTPNAEQVAFVTIGVEFFNSAGTVPATRLTVLVLHDGELVEEFVLADLMRIPQGEHAIEQRYIPATGFEPGTYTFNLVLEAVDPSTGTVTPLLSVEDAATLEVP